MTGVGAGGEEKMVGQLKNFLKYILHHLILSPALSTNINLDNVKGILVPNICHIEF